MFISSSVESVKYRGYEMTNRALNISTCNYVYKDKYSEYPDNEGIPAISFVFSNFSIQWVYKTHEDRDKDHDAIMHNRYGSDGILK